MKKIITFLIVLASMIQYGFAAPTDSVDTGLLHKKVDTIINNTKTLQDTVKAMKKELKDSLQSGFAKKDRNCNPVIKEVDTGDIGKWLLIFSPFLLLILVVVIVNHYLTDFKFSEALTENEPPKKVIKNPEYNASVIAANANISNLSILFPTTIEVSNIPPTLTDLNEIAASKDAALQALELALKEAKTSEPDLKKMADDAEAKLTELEGKSAALKDNVTSADAALKAAPGDATATARLDEANKLAEENKNATNEARANFEAAKKKASDNTANIKSLPAQIEKAKQDAADSRKNIDVFQKLTVDGTLFSPTTYRPSISRYIAFISSLVIILMTVCMSSFFIYHYIRTGCPPEFGALTVMLIALGLGVTPYITNKIAKAASASTT